MVLGQEGEENGEGVHEGDAGIEVETEVRIG